MVYSFHITKAQTWAFKLGNGTFVTHCISKNRLVPPRSLLIIIVNLLSFVQLRRQWIFLLGTTKTCIIVVSGVFDWWSRRRRLSQAARWSCRLLSQTTTGTSPLVGSGDPKQDSQSWRGDVSTEPIRHQRGGKRHIQDIYNLGCLSEPWLDERLLAEISTLNTKHWSGITLNSE